MVNLVIGFAIRLPQLLGTSKVIVPETDSLVSSKSEAAGSEQEKFIVAFSPISWFVPVFINWIVFVIVPVPEISSTSFSSGPETLSKIVFFS